MLCRAVVSAALLLAVGILPACHAARRSHRGYEDILTNRLHAVQQRDRPSHDLTSFALPVEPEPSSSDIGRSLLSDTSLLSSTELRALQDLYEVTDGPNWFWRPQAQFGAVWSFDDPAVNPCAEQWQGINCSAGGNATSSVSVLGLRQYNLRGPLPTSLGHLTGLTFLTLSENRLTGSIPSSVTSLAALQFLDLNNNLISSSIPKEIGSMESLRGIALYYCGITGSIPQSIGKLSSLIGLEVDSNCISGSLPSTLTEMLNLQFIYMYSNRVSGTIPSNIGKLSKLTVLNAFSNRIGGSIPTSISLCSPMKLLLLNDNRLTGTIPPEIGSLVNLDTLYLHVNELFGDIPSTIGVLSAVRIFSVHDNLLAGTIPSELGKMSSLEILDFYENSITGIIPLELGNIGASLQYFLSFANFMTSTVPTSFGNLVGLTILDITQNEMTGRLPTEIGNLQSLQFCLLSRNKFTGSLPVLLWEMQDLVDLDVSDNRLGGELVQGARDPAVAASSLQSVNLEHNEFTGTIPTFFGHMSSLRTVLLNNNKFKGKLGGVFSISNGSSVSVIDVSNNLLSGSIPSDIFALPDLAVFASVNNCFEGSFPEFICDALSLSTLACDGAGAAKDCGSDYGASHTSMSGELPVCLFELPSLDTLHVSGNALTGILPSNVSQNLKDLVMSHNVLHGTISKNLQAIQWNVFDVSNNVLSGRLHDSIKKPANQATIHMDINYLSGEIPENLKDAQDISLLGGNLFQCDVEKTSLPLHDDSRESYECGSNTMNAILYVWAILLGFTLIVAVLIYFEFVNLSTSWDSARQIQEWYSVFQRSHSSSIVIFHRFLDSVNYTCLFCIGFFLLLLPCFGVLKSYYGTYQDQYGWKVGALYMTGVPPGMLVAVIWAAIPVVFFSFRPIARVVVAFFGRKPGKTKLLGSEGCNSNESVTTVNTSYAPVSDERSTTAVMKSVSAKTNLLLVSFVLVDFCVITGAYMLYVYTFFTYNAQNSDLLLRFLQFFIAMFQLVLNGRVIPSIFSYVDHSNSLDAVNGNDQESSIISGSTYYSLMVLFNTIGAPVVATASFSSHCFYEYIVPSDEVEVTYRYPYCQAYTLVGDDLSCDTFGEVVRHTSYQPQFSYSYQCGSDFITYFSPIFMFVFLMISFAIPSVQFLAFYLETKGSFPTVHRVLHLFSSDLTKTLYRLKNSLNDSQVPDKSDDTKVIFKAHLFVSNLVKFAAVVLTFGLMYPPLGICGIVAILVYTTIVRAEIGRAMSDFSGNERLSLILQRDIRRTAPMFVRMVYVLLPFAGLFYMFFLNDLFGEPGQDSWVLSVTVSVSCVLASTLLAWVIGAIVVRGKSNADATSERITTIECRTVSDHLTSHDHQ